VRRRVDDCECIRLLATTNFMVIVRIVCVRRIFDIGFAGRLLRFCYCDRLLGGFGGLLLVERTVIFLVFGDAGLGNVIDVSHTLRVWGLGGKEMRKVHGRIGVVAADVRYVVYSSCPGNVSCSPGR